jgi:hypothetical protein
MQGQGSMTVDKSKANKVLNLPLPKHIHYHYQRNSAKMHEYSRTSIYRFSRGWRKQTMNAGKRLIRETTLFNKKSHTLSFDSWQKFASIENMTF